MKLKGPSDKGGGPEKGTVVTNQKVWCQVGGKLYRGRLEPKKQKATDKQG